MSAQGPSPGETGELCSLQTTLASMIQSLFNYWCLKSETVESQTLRNSRAMSHHGGFQGRQAWQLLIATSYNKGM